MAQMLPVGHVVFVHRRAPAEDVVADEKVVHHADDHRDERDAEKDADLMIKLVDTDLMRGGQRALDQIIERRIPVLIATPTSTRNQVTKMMSDVPRIDQYCQRCGQ